MSTFLKKNLVTILIVSATLILAGVAVFTAIRLYQTRQTAVAPNAPASKPAAAGTGAQCGATCTTSADCASTGANGGPEGCVQGTCQNLLCPAGHTLPGPNCDCNLAGRTCGQTCNASVGLCDSASGSTCAFITGPTCPGDSSAGSTATYCVPNNIWANQNPPTGWSSAACNGGNPANNGGNHYVLFNGANPTLSDVQSACASVINPSTAPTPTPAAGSCQVTFNIAAASATPSPTASASPTPVPQCGTTCTTNSDCPSSMVCYVGICRNAACTTDSSCICATATPTPSPTPTAIVYATATPTVTAKPSLPVSGNDLPTILGIAGGVILLLTGLIFVL